VRSALGFGAVLLLATAPAAFAGRLSPALVRAMSDRKGSDGIEVLVVLREQAPISALDERLRAAHAPRAERHRAVVDALRETAGRTQGPILSELAAGRRSGLVRGCTSYWLVNAIGVAATADHVRALADRSDVDRIEPALAVELLGPETAERARGERAAASIGITAGLVAIQARRVWTELGFDGTGALVANLDTGVDGTHPALAARWRGNFAPAAECWRDGAGFGDAVPVDRHAHGTHVMGTMCGLAALDTIGVAPGALWIADNSIHQGVGFPFDVDVLASFQWFADPDGNSATTDDVPDVVQNSWGVNELLGYLDCDSRWWTMIDHCEAAGVVVTWSAGGDGPGAGTLRSPADRATTPYNTFAVGTTFATSPYSIAPFSSRGPSGCGGPYATKPEVVAPGVDTYSAVPGGGYEVWSGSAMAGPHVAGVVALMRAADPDADVDTIKQILMDTATDLGPAGEDDAYGHGFLNAYDAVVAVLQGATAAAIPATPPGRFELGPPRPSPTAGTTSIDYAVPTGTADLSIAIHDVAGRLVRTLVHGAIPAGRHVAAWNGRDAKGRLVGPGVYFCRMEAGAFSQVRKVTFLR
jgi:bacillopeptidase F